MDKKKISFIYDKSLFLAPSKLFKKKYLQMYNDFKILKIAWEPNIFDYRRIGVEGGGIGDR